MLRSVLLSLHIAAAVGERVLLWVAKRDVASHFVRNFSGTRCMREGEGGASSTLDAIDG